MTFYKETEFRDSLIGKIPRDWDVRELEDESIAAIIAGQSPPSSTYNKENLGLPFLQGKMEFGAMFPSPTTYCSKPIKVAKKDDVLLSVRAPVGDTNVAPFECCIGRGLAAIRAKVDRLSHMFLFYYLKHEGKRFEALSTGSTFKAIRMQEIERFSIPVPSLVEQKAIVGVLGVVDLAVAKTGEVIAKTERLKKGLMQELLTKGIGHKEYKQTLIGTIPNNWLVARLGDYADYRNGINFNKKQRTSQGTLTIDVLNMYGESIYVDLKNLYRVNIAENEDCLLKKGDILFVRSSLKREGVGWTSLFEGSTEPVTFCSFIIRARLKSNSNISPEFLTYFLRSDITRRRLIANAGQVAISNITQDSLKALMFPIPPAEEQQKIVNIISTLDKKLGLEKSEKAKLEHIKQGLMDLLLTGKIRVKVS
jgi:type I restriction enzyme S subunit